jgi:ribonuclease J
LTFTIHRGASEIGGSCVEVCTAKTRIVVDIGMPLVNPDGSQFNSAKLKNISTEDLRKRKILPDIPALYDSSKDKETALLISHPHQDYYGLIAYADKKIPVYVGEAAHKLMELSVVFAGTSGETPGKNKVIGNPCYFETYKHFISAIWRSRRI